MHFILRIKNIFLKKNKNYLIDFNITFYLYEIKLNKLIYIKLII